MHALYIYYVQLRPQIRNPAANINVNSIYFMHMFTLIKLSVDLKKSNI